MKTSTPIAARRHRGSLVRRLAVLVAIFAAGSAQAAVTQMPGSVFSQLTNSNMLSVTVPAGSNRLLVVTASDPGSNLAPSAISFGGSPLTLVANANDGFFALDTIWVRAMGTSASPTTANVVVTGFMGTDVKFLSAVTYDGVDQATPASAGPTASITPGVNISSNLMVPSAAGDVVFDVFDAFLGVSTAAATPIAGQTGVHDLSNALAFGFAHYRTSTRPGAAPNVTMGWTSTAEAILHATINIKAVANAPAPAITQGVTTLTVQSTAGLVVTGGGTTHFKITGITGTTLHKTAGTSQPVVNNDFITAAEGAAGLRFTPTTTTPAFNVAGAFSNAGAGLGPTTAANLVVASVVAAGDLVIREFRERGTSGTAAADEYVVIHNRTASPITVGALDGSTGFAVAKEPGTVVFTIPNGTIIKANGHFLGANDTNGATILGVTPNVPWSADIGDGLGLGLFQSATSFTAPNALDAVGFNTPSAAPFIEGTGLPSLAAVNGEYAWVRKAPNGVVQDTNNNLGTGANLGDFTLAATDGVLYNGVQSVLGAPAPTGINTWDTYSGLIIGMVEPLVGPNNNPNRIRKNDAPGGGDRLEFRRRITNNTGAAITSLRLRFTEITTFNSPGYTPGITQADLRPNTSITVAPNIVTSLGSLAPLGLTLVTPPAQAIGGGLNSIITIPGGLGIGASIDVNISLRVSRVGAYRFFATVEAK